MANTAKLNLPLISASQSQKSVTHNESLDNLDIFVMPSIKDRDLTAPPGGESEGDTYIPTSTATGDWAGKEDQIAAFQNGAYAFYPPSEGWVVWIDDENMSIVYDGAAWITNPSTIQNMLLLGVNTTADATNKLAVNSSAILFNNVGNGVQVKVNKNAVGDTNSFLFQTSFSGRAEMGCAGDDDFHFKVSPDNFSTTYEAMVVDKDDGWTKFLGINTVSATELTISTGVVTVTQTPHKIDTESDDATDDLVTINGGTEGKIIIIEPADDARTVVVKNASGNIRNSSGADVSLDAYGQSWMGRHDGSNWIQIGGKA